MKESNYSNPELRPFGAFFEDLDAEQLIKHQNTKSMLYRLESVAEGAGYVFVSILSYALNGGLIPKNADKSQRYNVAAYYNNASGNWVVLEWNKVRGICEREYRHVAFMKKILKDYDLTSGGWESNDVVDFEEVAPHIPKLFPKINDFEIKVIDKPSEMYAHRHIRSCMVGTDYVKFYDTAPCKGLMVYYKGEPVSRTLLWTLQDGRKVMGRIYDTSGHGASLLTSYALDNGYLTDMPYDAYAVAPICKDGIPYLDDLGVEVWRVGNEIYMFASGRYARSFKNTIGADKILHESNGYSQSGNDDEFCIEFVEHNGKLVNPNELITIDGELVNVNDYDTAFPDTLIPGVTDNNLFRYWDGDKWTLVYGRDLCVVGSDVYLLAETVTTISGERIHYMYSQFVMDFKDGQLVFVGLGSFNSSECRSLAYINQFCDIAKDREFAASLIPAEVRQEFQMLDDDQFVRTVIGNMRMDPDTYYQSFRKNFRS